VNVSNRKVQTVILIFLGFISLYILPSPVQSADLHPKITEFEWSRIKNAYRVTAKLKNGFNTEIEESIHAGIPTSFHFYLSFKRVRSYWDNKIIEKAEYNHTVKYDTLRKLYTVIIQKPKNPDPIFKTTTDDTEEMQQLMTSFKGYLSIVNPVMERQHYISLRATLHTGKMPAPWNRILFFISNDFDTKTSRQFLPIDIRK